MLNEAQEKYLVTIPEEKRVTIHPLNPKLENTANEIITQAQALVPSLKVLHMGASGLGISGQGDLDIYLLAPAADFARHLPQIVQAFGLPKSQGQTSVAWEFERNGFPVELYLTDPDSPAMRDQIRIYEILRDNDGLRKDYEALKQKFDGLPFRDYQRAKYEFYNRLLAVDKDVNHE